MAKKNARAEDETKAELNMSSMMDACFLLIIFFVVNASQITVAKDPCVKMPNAIIDTDHIEYLLFGVSAVFIVWNTGLMFRHCYLLYTAPEHYTPNAH